VIRALTATAGGLRPSQLSTAHVLEALHRCASPPLALTTRFNRHNAARRILRWLWEEHGAPKLDSHVPKLLTPRPRNVIANRDTIETILDAATLELRLFLLLCSDLAIRSGTAAKISPRQYDKATGFLRFTTKKDAHLGLPVTAEIADILNTCDLQSTVPFVTQLRQRIRPNRANQQAGYILNATQLRHQFRRLRERLNLPKRIIPHDLRRTTAVALYKQTHDLRQVQALLGHRSLQSTIWYLDHDLEDVDLATLEAIKKPTPAIVWRKEQTA
jgi:integrase